MSLTPSRTRSQACQTCRKRKLKCDGAKPACGACARSAQIHGDDVDVLVCSYDDPTVKKKRASPTSAAKVAALEAEVGASVLLAPTRSAQKITR